MDEVELLRRAGRLAAEQPMPAIDVVSGVLLEIDRRQAKSLGGVGFAAVAASVAAVLTGAAAWTSLAPLTDPLAALVSPFFLVLS
jgi:hypothetical protein